MLERTRAQLDEYFAGERREFDLPLDPRGTEFQRRVWQRLLHIDYGETTTYGALARELGDPGASRAVGLANGSNPIPIVIPCHRVIGADGSLTGFGGGLPIKAALLELERVRDTAAPVLARHGVEEPHDVKEHRRGEADGIHAVQHAAVAFDHHAPVLGAEAALHRRQRQAAEESHDHDDGGDGRGLPAA